MARKKILDLSDETRAYFSAASARRLRADRPCAVCETIMRGAISKRRYCSTACHSKAARQRQRERETTTATR
jgi:hypothetical protein